MDLQKRERLENQPLRAKNFLRISVTPAYAFVAVYCTINSGVVRM